jgi:hypothetical protein
MGLYWSLIRIALYMSEKWIIFMIILLIRCWRYKISKRVPINIMLIRFCDFILKVLKLFMWYLLLIISHRLFNYFKPR